MYKHDFRRLLQFAHQRFEQTGLEQWKHSEKWNSYCEVCKAHEIFESYKITMVSKLRIKTNSIRSLLVV